MKFQLKNNKCGWFSRRERKSSSNIRQIRLEGPRYDNVGEYFDLFPLGKLLISLLSSKEQRRGAGGGGGEIPPTFCDRHESNEEANKKPHRFPDRVYYFIHYLIVIPTKTTRGARLISPGLAR